MEIAVRAFAAVTPRHGASGRHHRRPENPRRRSPPDRQQPHPPGRHRRAGRRSALPQYQRRALDLRRRRARRTDQTLRRQELDLSYQGGHRPPRPHRGALRGRRRGHPEMAGVERLGAGADADLARLRGGRKGRARGQGRDVAGRVHRAVGLARPQQEDRHSRRRQAAGECQGDPAGIGFGTGARPRPTAPSRATSTAPANASFISRRAAGMRRSR